MTFWNPDTCADPFCDFDVTDDGAFTLISVLSKCSAHTALSDADAFAAGKDESNRKNYSLKELVSELPSLADGATWSFDGSRVLQLVVPGATGGEIATLQAALDALFGSGKVVVS